VDDEAMYDYTSAPIRLTTLVMSGGWNWVEEYCIARIKYRVIHRKYKYFWR
jgi:hypothetical protein